MSDWNIDWSNAGAVERFNRAVKREFYKKGPGYPTLVGPNFDPEDGPGTAKYLRYSEAELKHAYKI